MICKNCGDDKAETDFYPGGKIRRKGPRRKNCLLCQKILRTRLERSRRPRYMAENPLAWRLKEIEKEAKRKGLEFNLTIADFPIVPTHCPVLGIPIHWDKQDTNGLHDDHQITFDRINPTRGYVRGNVALISWRANRFKRALTKEAILALAAYVSAH